MTSSATAFFSSSSSNQGYEVHDKRRRISGGAMRKKGRFDLQDLPQSLLKPEASSSEAFISHLPLKWRMLKNSENEPLPAASAATTAASAATSRVGQNALAPQPPVARATAFPAAAHAGASKRRITDTNYIIEVGKLNDRVRGYDEFMADVEESVKQRSMKVESQICAYIEMAAQYEVKALCDKKAPSKFFDSVMLLNFMKKVRAFRTKLPLALAYPLVFLSNDGYDRDSVITLLIKIEKDLVWEWFSLHSANLYKPKAVMRSTVMEVLQGAPREEDGAIYFACELDLELDFVTLLHNFYSARPGEVLECIASDKSALKPRLKEHLRILTEQIKEASVEQANASEEEIQEDVEDRISNLEIEKTRAEEKIKIIQDLGWFNSRV